MNNKIMMGLVALVVIGGLAIYKVTERQDDSGAASDRASAGKQLPEIDKDKIDELAVTVPEEAPVVLSKKDGAWRITAPLDAKPNERSITDAIDKLTSMTVRRVAATNPENHAALEVSEDKGIRVVAKAAGSNQADLWIGKFGGGEQMIRVQGKDAVLGIKESLKWAFNKKLKDWRDRTITDEASTDLQAVRFEGKEAFSFAKVGTEWTLGEGQKKIAEFDASKVSSFASTLARLSATDFADPRATPETTGLASPARVVLEFEKEAPPQGDAGPAAPIKSSVTLLVGGEKDGNVYVQREGNDLVYLVSSYSAEKLRPTTESFQQSEDDDTAAAPPSAITPAPGGQANIPPDVMAKIQAQLAAQQGR